MDIAVTLVALTATVLAGASVARRFEVPAPLLLVVVGVVASFVPFIPQVHLSS